MSHHIVSVMLISTLFLQEQAHDAKQQAVSPEDTEDLSPLPSAVQQPARRRGGISAEPVSEEDATSYVKKVWYSFLCTVQICITSCHTESSPADWSTFSTMNVMWMILKNSVCASKETHWINLLHINLSIDAQGNNHYLFWEIKHTNVPVVCG